MSFSLSANRRGRRAIIHAAGGVGPERPLQGGENAAEQLQAGHRAGVHGEVRRPHHPGSDCLVVCSWLWASKCDKAID